MSLILAASHAYAAPPLPDLPIPQNFGVNTHFLDEDLPAHMRYLKESGFGWIRRDLYWHGVERKPGVYDFAAYDRLVDAARDNQLRILFILDYNNPLYDQGASPNSVQGREAFAAFAAAAIVIRCAAASRAQSNETTITTRRFERRHGAGASIGRGSQQGPQAEAGHDRSAKTN